jgi:hypothetical protein
MKSHKITIVVFIGFLVWDGVCINYAKAGVLPNPKLTPGLARQVDKNMLCTTSTKLVRNVPEALKKRAYVAYGLTGNHTGYCLGQGGCEIDHLISLELGGDNGDLGSDKGTKNLWPQPYFGKCNARQKDVLENQLHKLICNGTVTMQDAQSAISTNWVSAYTKYIDPKGCN